MNCLLWRGIVFRVVPTLVSLATCLPIVAEAQTLKAREILGPVRVADDQTFEVLVSNVRSARSSLVAIRIFDEQGVFVSGVGYDPKGQVPNPMELEGGATQSLGVTAQDVPGAGEVPVGSYVAVAELFQTTDATHAPLLSAQVVNRDGTVGIWGTGGVALNAIWGTGGVARTGIWGTGGVARTGIWGTGGVAWHETFGAFPPVRVGANEVYRLTAQNPYDDEIEIEMIAIDLRTGVETATGNFSLAPGQSRPFDISPGVTEVVGLVRVNATSASDPGPLVTMQVLRFQDGPAGIWGTGGVAYAPPAE